MSLIVTVETDDIYEDGEFDTAQELGDWLAEVLTENPGEDSYDIEIHYD